jgi:hypothetical protein
MLWLVIAFLVGIPAAIALAPRARVAFEWTRMRSRLLAEARAAGLDGAWERASLTRVGWELIYTATNIALVARRGERSITLSPHSIGWRREDPPWTWWWIDIEPVAPKQRFSFHVVKRREDTYRHPKQRDHATGDEAFDAALRVYTFESDNPEANQRSLTALNRVLARTEVRDILREVLVGNTDSVNLSSGKTRVSRRRNGLSIAEVLAQVELMTRLADAVDEAFIDRLYR